MWPFGVSHLPLANGPYIPACVDVMTEYSKDGLFFRIYYPSNKKGKITDYESDWIPWIPHDSYIHGFARVVMTWVLVVRFVIWFISGKIRVPLIYGANVKTDKKLKCLIFSHGLGGGRFLYSSTCIELASRGFLVASIEHRDDSSGSTYYYSSLENAKCDKKTYISFVPIKFGNNHYPVRNAQKHEGQVVLSLSHLMHLGHFCGYVTSLFYAHPVKVKIMVQKRSEECQKLFNLLKAIEEGKVPHNVLTDVPSSSSESDFKLEDLTGHLDIEDMSIMGHSFGAATSLLTLFKNKHLKRGIILDPWMFPIKDVPELITDVRQPLLFINTQTFHIASNINVMEQFVDENPDSRPVYTILHTTHENQTDTVFVVGYWLNWFMKKLTAGNAMKINNSLILSFLKKEINFSEDVNDCDAYLLQETENVVTGIPALRNIVKC